jgi:small subunit ribosomal protein S20
MANHKSAIKRHRQSLKRRDRNRTQRAAVRNAIKETRVAAEAGEKTKALELLKSAEKLISTTSGRGLYHPRNASRKVSRLAVYVNKALAGEKATAAKTQAAKKA